MLLSNFLATAIWTFQDLFLGLISYAIAERFKQIRELLKDILGKVSCYINGIP